ncbi:hypothetical protein ACWGE1_20680 [Streptomyces sp. NPDC054932]
MQLVVGAGRAEVGFEGVVGGVPDDPELLELGCPFSGHGSGPVGAPLVGEAPSEREGHQCRLNGPDPERTGRPTGRRGPPSPRSATSRPSSAATSKQHEHFGKVHAAALRGDHTTARTLLAEGRRISATTTVAPLTP